MTRGGITQIFYRWRSPRLPWQFYDSNSDDRHGNYDSDVDEDEVDFSIGSATIGFRWVDIMEDDERNYALCVNRDFYEHAVSMESTLNQRIATMESDILGVLNSQRLRAAPEVTTAVTTAFAEFRVELANLFRAHRHQFN